MDLSLLSWIICEIVKKVAAKEDALSFAISSGADTIADAVRQPGSFEWTPETGGTLAVAIIALVISALAIVIPVFQNRRHLSAEIVGYDMEPHPWLDDDTGSCNELVLLFFLNNQSASSIAIPWMSIRFPSGREYICTTRPSLLHDAVTHPREDKCGVTCVEDYSILYSSEFPLNIEAHSVQKAYVEFLFPAALTPHNIGDADIIIHANKGPALIKALHIEGSGIRPAKFYGFLPLDVSETSL